MNSGCQPHHKEAHLQVNEAGELQAAIQSAQRMLVGEILAQPDKLESGNTEAHRSVTSFRRCHKSRHDGARTLYSLLLHQEYTLSGGVE